MERSYLARTLPLSRRLVCFLTRSPFSDEQKSLGFTDFMAKLSDEGKKYYTEVVSCLAGLEESS